MSLSLLFQSIASHSPDLSTHLSCFHSQDPDPSPWPRKRLQKLKKPLVALSDLVSQSPPSLPPMLLPKRARMNQPRRARVPPREERRLETKMKPLLLWLQSRRSPVSTISYHTQFKFKFCAFFKHRHHGTSSCHVFELKRGVVSLYDGTTLIHYGTTCLIRLYMVCTH